MPRAGRGVALATPAPMRGRAEQRCQQEIVYDVPLGEPTAEGYHSGKRATGRESAARSVGVMLAGVKDAYGVPLVTRTGRAADCYSHSAALTTTMVICVHRFLGFET